MTSIIQRLIDRPGIPRSNALLFASSLVALALIGAIFILRTNLNQELNLQEQWSETSLIATDRAITQLQRELLKLVYLIEADVDMEPVNLEVDIVQSRVFYFQQFSSQEIIPPEMRQDFAAINTRWMEIQPLIADWQSQPGENQNQERLTTALIDLEFFTNDIISRLSVIRAQSLKDSTERLAFLSNLIGLTFSILIIFLAITSISAIRFIRDRRQANVALAQSEELFRLLFDFAATGMAMVSLDGRFLRINSSFTKITGYSPEELLNKTFLDITHPDDLSLSQNQTQNLLSRPQESIQVEKRYIHKEGHIIIALLAAAAIQSPDHQPLFFISQIIDITERKKNEESLLQTQKLESIGLLAGGIAHDFNNLLTAVMTQTSIAAFKLPKNHPVQDNIEKVISASERAASLTQQLLAYTGKGQFQIKPVNLNNIVQENLELLEAMLPKHVKLITELTPSVPFISADIGNIQQVIMNLVINAAEAIEGQSGLVQVKTAVVAFDSNKKTLGATNLTPGQYVCLQVKDNGAGIDSEIQERIFEPFFTTKANGRGLGLSAILGIIQTHDGGLQLSSEMGQGTTFDCYFPIIEVAEKDTDPTTGKRISPPTDAISVLVIDDEESIRLAVVDILSTFDINVITAENGQAGLEIYKENQDQITVILLDMNMPVMGGLETMEAINQINPEVKIILSSGYTETRPHSAKTENGRVSFLYKPYKIEKLLEKIYQ